MTTTAPVDARTSGLAALTFARRFTDGLLQDFPDDKLTWQPFDGANHVLWNVGHLAWTDDYFLCAVAGQPTGLDESWPAIFGMKSEPVDDPGHYPAMKTVRAAYDERRRALVEWFRSLDDAGIAEPLPEALRGFAENPAILIATLAAHECMHNGQVTCVRKALGLPRLHG